MQIQTPFLTLQSDVIVWQNHPDLRLESASTHLHAVTSVWGRHPPFVCKRPSDWRRQHARQRRLLIGRGARAVSDWLSPAFPASLAATRTLSTWPCRDRAQGLDTSRRSEGAGATRSEHGYPRCIVFCMMSG